ncbi:hypothetical protein HK405_009661, partial [Cladochytrium tenue]
SASAVASEASSAHGSAVSSLSTTATTATDNTVMSSSSASVSPSSLATVPDTSAFPSSSSSSESSSSSSSETSSSSSSSLSSSSSTVQSSSQDSSSLSSSAPSSSASEPTSQSVSTDASSSVPSSQTSSAASLTSQLLSTSFSGTVPVTTVVITENSTTLLTSTVDGSGASTTTFDSTSTSNSTDGGSIYSSPSYTSPVLYAVIAILAFAGACTLVWAFRAMSRKYEFDGPWNKSERRRRRIERFARTSSHASSSSALVSNTPAEDLDPSRPEDDGPAALGVLLSGDGADSAVPGSAIRSPSSPLLTSTGPAPAQGLAALGSHVVGQYPGSTFAQLPPPPPSSVFHTAMRPTFPVEMSQYDGQHSFITAPSPSPSPATARSSASDALEMLAVATLAPDPVAVGSRASPTTSVLNVLSPQRTSSSPEPDSTPPLSSLPHGPSQLPSTTAARGPALGRSPETSPQFLPAAPSATPRSPFPSLSPSHHPQQTAFLAIPTPAADGLHVVPVSLPRSLPHPSPPAAVYSGPLPHPGDFVASDSHLSPVQPIFFTLPPAPLPVLLPGTADPISPSPTIFWTLPPTTPVPETSAPATATVASASGNLANDAESTRSIYYTVRSVAPDLGPDGLDSSGIGAPSGSRLSPAPVAAETVATGDSVPAASPTSRPRPKPAFFGPRRYRSSLQLMGSGSAAAASETSTQQPPPAPTSLPPPQQQPRALQVAIEISDDADRPAQAAPQSGRRRNRRLLSISPWLPAARRTPIQTLSTHAAASPPSASPPPRSPSAPPPVAAAAAPLRSILVVPSAVPASARRRADLDPDSDSEDADNDADAPIAPPPSQQLPRRASAAGGAGFPLRASWSDQHLQPLATTYEPPATDAYRSRRASAAALLPPFLRWPHALAGAAARLPPPAGNDDADDDDRTEAGGDGGAGARRASTASTSATSPQNARRRRSRRTVASSRASSSDLTYVAAGTSSASTPPSSAPPSRPASASGAQMLKDRDDAARE